MALLASLSDEVVCLFGGAVDSSADEQRDQPCSHSLPRHAGLDHGGGHFASWRTHLVVAEAHSARIQYTQDEDNDRRRGHACRENAPCDWYE